jgi:hypothetical protein
MDVISSSAQGDSAPAAQQTNELTKFSLNPAEADCFFRLLAIVYGLSASAITHIKDSKIFGMLKTGAGIFRVDLTNLTKAVGKNLTMSFINAPNQSKSFSVFKASKKVYIREISELTAYEITDHQNTVFLPKSFRNGKVVVIPDLSPKEMVGVKVTIKKFKKMKSAAQASYRPYSNIGLYQEQLTTIELPGLEPYVLDSGAYRACNGKPDEVLKSFTLNLAPSDEIHLSVFQRSDGYWLQSEVEIALGVTFEIFEPMIVGHQ